MSYLLLKYIHILSSTLLFGTGLGTAFHGFLAFRTKIRAWWRRWGALWCWPTGCSRLRQS